jgi:hypothetical protein
VSHWRCGFDTVIVQSHPLHFVRKGKLWAWAWEGVRFGMMRRYSRDMMWSCENVCRE